MVSVTLIDVALFNRARGDDLRDLLNQDLFSYVPSRMRLTDVLRSPLNCTTTFKWGKRRGKGIRKHVRRMKAQGKWRPSVETVTITRTSVVYSNLR